MTSTAAFLLLLLTRHSRQTTHIAKVSLPSAAPPPAENPQDTKRHTTIICILELLAPLLDRYTTDLKNGDPRI